MKSRRRLFQVLIFLFFLTIFFFTVYPLENVPENPFTRVSPLSGLVLALLGRVTIILAVGGLVLLLTALFGRFFCGWFCPLGTHFDMCAMVFKRFGKSTGKLELSWIKYGVLAAVLAGAVFGVLHLHWFEPVTLIYRFYTFTVFPGVFYGWRLLQMHIPELSGIELSYGAVPFRSEGYVFLALFGVLFFLGLWRKRFYCRNICPLGALLSLFARFSLLRMRITDACVGCGKCMRECKMGAIPPDPREYRTTECIDCFSCVETCPTKALYFKLEAPGNLRDIGKSISGFFRGKELISPDASSGFSRRRFLGGVALGAAGAVFARVQTGAGVRGDEIVRPPGALPEDDFNASCIRCGECMKVCISGGLRPAGFGAGVAGVMTPVLVPRVGHCEFHCDLCGRVCPTGAVQKFGVADKKQIKIGSAEIDRSLCLAWTSVHDCLVCDEHCPVKAIYWKETEGKLRPIVDENVCIGCGDCENKCPVKGRAAIRVTRVGEERVKMREGESFRRVQVIPDDSPSLMNPGRPLPSWGDGIGS